MPRTHHIATALTTLTLFSLTACHPNTNNTPTSSKQTQTCRVIKIADGDTLTCLTPQQQKLKVRLHAIDAPEKDQAYGQQAKKHLSELVADKTITLNITDKDRYGRTVADVFSGSLNVNQQMVKDGYSWAYRQYGGDAYAKDEARAKSQRLGLWRDRNPINPADWRHRK